MANLDHDEKDEQFLVALQLVEINVHGMHGGSRLGKQPNIVSDRMFGDERIVRNYFAPNPMYDECHFLHQFRMQHSFFLLIVATMNTHYLYFV